jgi:hypothetical protein
VVKVASGIRTGGGLNGVVFEVAVVEMEDSVEFLSNWIHGVGPGAEICCEKL